MIIINSEKITDFGLKQQFLADYPKGVARMEWNETKQFDLICSDEEWRGYMGYLFSLGVLPSYPMPMNFSKKKLNGRTFKLMDFSSASFGHSDLKGTRFELCLFNNVTFYKSDMQGAKFEQCIFFSCKFELCSVDEDTLFVSCGSTWNTATNPYIFNDLGLGIDL